MRTPVHIALIGDYDPEVTAHQAIPVALELAREVTRTHIEQLWLPTAKINDTSQLKQFDAFWCVPGSPYRSMDGALLAIRFARETGRPFLGTCGGFQHAIVEYARNVLGWADAAHAETVPGATRAVISELACALVEATETVRLLPGTRIAEAYGAGEATEGYHCRYGLNPRFREELVAGPLRTSAVTDAGDIRAVELDGHPFFVAVLFQPERAALTGQVPPLVAAFVRAGADGRRA